MPNYQFEALSATGDEIKDVIEAATEEEAQSTIREMGYYVTRISIKKDRGAVKTVGGSRKKGLAIGGIKPKMMTLFTRQLSILQDAGLPVLRSLKILEGQAKGGRLKNSLMDVCDAIEGGATLSEGFGKAPKAFNRLYVNMIKAGEAGGALELILQRLADFMERAQQLRNKVKGAMVYPAVVMSIAILIVAGIMYFLVPSFIHMFEEMDLTMPAITLMLKNISEQTVKYWYAIPAIPLGIWLIVSILRKFSYGRMGWDLFLIRVPVVGALIEKNIMSRTCRTLGTLVQSGVPILDALNITRETSNHAMFERMLTRVSESIREGDTIAVPLKKYSVPPLNVLSLFFWFILGASPLAFISVFAPAMQQEILYVAGGFGVLAVLIYIIRSKKRVVDDLVVNMVDVGEESGELDTMLYKVADYYDDEVQTMAESLTRIIEPILIVFLGVVVGFIVIALITPLFSMITQLSQ
ncbi:MAG: type II secretion system F family protein [Pirellulaceae bacterium]|nr:type II secretion system F family protein [Pirellulaceae bacterium]